MKMLPAIPGPPPKLRYLWSALLCILCAFEAASGTTNEKSAEVIEGTYVGSGIECPIFKMTDGNQVTLSGRLPTLDTGLKFKLAGRWARVSTCMQGRTFHVFDAEEVTESP